MSTDDEVRGVIELAGTLTRDPVVLHVTYDGDAKRGQCWRVGPTDGPYYQAKTIRGACRKWQQAYARAARDQT